MTFIQVQFEVEFYASCEPAENTDDMHATLCQTNPRNPRNPRKKTIFSKIGIYYENIMGLSIGTCEYHKVSCKYFAGIDCGCYAFLTPYLLCDIQFHLF
jgi:hypothetical protein